MLRSAVESLTRSWRFERSLAVGPSRVPIVVSPSAGLRYLFKPLAQVDPSLLAMARQYVKPGATVWDIGANVGLFAFVAAALAGDKGRVFCFEPDAWLVQLLRKSAARQPGASAQVQVIPTAVAGRLGIRTLCIARRSRSANYLSEYADLVPFITHGASETLSVIAVTLDWLAEHLPPPDLVKIDVEGAELEVLQGAEALLTRCRPVVLCEVFEPSSPAITELFRTRRYRLLDHEGRETPRAAWNTVAIPLP